MRVIFATVIGVFLTMTPVSAAPPDVNDIVQQMQQVFEPAQPSTRKAVISIEGRENKSDL